MILDKHIGHETVQINNNWNIVCDVRLKIFR